MKLEVKNGSENYAATVVKISNLHDIEGADRIQRTVVFGNNVIISKEAKVGDTMIYFVSGTKLNSDFCKYNDLLTDAEQNKNKKAGYISHKQFRVKAIKLKGIISDGILLPIQNLVDFYNRIDVISESETGILLDFNYGKDISIADFKEGSTFTTINSLELCEKYIVPSARNGNPGGKAPKQPSRISRLVDKQFLLHNDTDNLRRNINKINPDDIIGIHYKKHGTSAVFGNVLVKKTLTWFQKLLQKFGVNIVDTEYDIVYSSRKVVKNQYLNPETGGGFYGENIWSVVAKEIKDLIPKGWTLYGEIIGYLPSGSFIQGGFDYGCKVGEHKFYVYKISVVNVDGKVIYLTDKQIEEYCEKVGLLYKDTFIYYGTVFDFCVKNKIEYTDENWKDLLLQKLEQKYNEKDCYMCTNKVPEEGIVLRVEKLESYEAYKLKSKRFILMESDNQEKEISNIEDNQDDIS